ncbi:MAG: Sec-independent protein translocase protein TatB [Janthinobacterium lividum]
MLDLGLSKLFVIGVVALVVIGPERLPRVARMAGALMGRAQRYMNDVKAEVTREIQLDELRNMKSSFEEAAQNVESTISENLRQQTGEINDAWSNGESVAPSMAGSSYDTYRPRRTDAAPPRKNWRAQQTAMPAWYKRSTVKRTRVLSGAARVARHRPASLRRPTRFF